MEAGATERAARGQRRERVTDRPLIGPSEYKHMVLGPIFLKYVEDAIDELINDQMESLTELQTDFADQPMPLSRAERR